MSEAIAREDCGSCGSSQLMIILDLGSSPVANYYPAGPAEMLTEYPLQLLRCHTCGLIQLGTIVPEDVLWRGEYGYYSSASDALRQHFADYANTLAARYPTLIADRVIDIGCNDGLLLAELAKLGGNVVGVDPAKGPTEVAQAAGLDVWTESFDMECAQGLLDEYGPPGIVVANNVAAHVADLDEFLSGLAMLTGDDGVLVMEVQYVPDLIAGNGFDLVYHEHRYFYSLATLTNALSLRNLRIVDAEHVNTQGGSIRIVARSADFYDPVPSRARKRIDAMLETESRFQYEAAYVGLQARADYVAERLRAMLDGLGGTIAGYGAPAKATTLLHWTKIAERLSWFEDTTPAKVGRYMPGTSLPILAAGHNHEPATYLLAAHNYAGHILPRMPGFFDRGGKVVIPLPVPVVIG